jgi:RES domain-containing protein
MPQYDDIRKRVQALHAYAYPWAGTVYRSCAVEHSRRSDLLTGIGASQNGGRWNSKGIKAVYSSLAPDTGMAEVLKTANYSGFAPSEFMPRLFVGIRVSLTKVLDLTGGQIRQMLRMSLQRLRGEDWIRVQLAGGEALTQQVGRAAMESGLEGIIAASAADIKGRNLVWFPDNLMASSTVVICNADDLPG